MEKLQGATFSLEHQYRVDERDAQIGFITRYDGHQLPFERPVWLGVYDRLTDAAADSRVYNRIKTSAKRAHRVDAPSVLSILDYGTLDRGVPFVVSERIPSTSLADHIEQHGPLPPADLVPLVEAVADGLETIHEAGLAHGNLTADWIHLHEDDPTAPRLSYFHVGLTLDELRRMDGAVLTPEIVRAYPPESFARETPAAAELDEDDDPTTTFTPVADVWALGAVTYELFVGFHPFFDDDEPGDASDGIARLQHEEARPLADFGIEPPLSDVVSRALAPDPNERFETPDAFARALKRARAKVSDLTPEEAETTSDDRESAPSIQSDDEGDSRPPSDPSHTAGDDELEPGGPASLLVTLVLVVFAASNLAWFVFFMRSDDAGLSSEDRPETRPPPESLRLETTPSGATVFDAEQQKLGKTPLAIPPERLADSPLELVVKKTGFDDHPVTLRRDDQTRILGVELRKSTTD